METLSHNPHDTVIFSMQERRKPSQNEWVTSGGRVLNAVGIGETNKAAGLRRILPIA